MPSMSFYLQYIIRDLLSDVTNPIQYDLGTSQFSKLQKKIYSWEIGLVEIYL